MMNNILRQSFLLFLACSLLSPAMAQDWPQFNGPTRDGILPSTFDLKKIPEAGLQKLWSAKIAGGYSGPAVADGRVFVTDYIIASGEIKNNPGGRDELTGDERVLCYAEQSGVLLWEHSDPRTVAVSYGIGPRATPAIDGEIAYTLGSEGNLLALNVKTGEVVWQVDLKKTYSAQTPIWGYSASPLVAGDLLYTLAGGDGSIVVALDKTTGKEVWKALSASGIGYCPPTLIQEQGQPQLIVWDADKLNSLDPKTGEVYWSEPLAPRYEMSIAPPSLNGDLMYASGIGEVSKMMRLKPNRSGVEVLWEGRPKIGVYSSNAAALFIGNMVVGSDCGSGELIGVDATTGDRFWSTWDATSQTDRRANHGTAFVFKAVDDLYYLFSETGDFIIARLSDQGYEEISRQHLIEPTNSCFDRNVVWSYPAFANGCIFVRNDVELACFTLGRDISSGAEM